MNTASKKRNIIPSIPGYIDSKEVSVLTGFSESRIYVFTSRKEIPHYKIGRRIYFKKADIKKWMAERTKFVPVEPKEKEVNV